MKKNNATFKEKVLIIVSKIKSGEVMTYGEVASEAGAFGAGRAVGSIMSKNIDINIPCHRVIRSDGKVSGYNGLRSKKVGSDSKISLLKKEGIIFTKNNKVDFKK